ncbi:MAG: FAD-dependent oxidoreductase [Methanomicrobia archaeon]|nr:FAD-dependent oxidoreductase [Methanomicrobia archaeon]
MKVVVLGCGFGGVEVARTLRKHTKDLDLILVDRSTRFEYQPAYPELLSGKVTPEEISSDLNRFAAKNSARFVHAEVVDIDFQAKLVKTRDMIQGEENDIAYDFLVIALGAEQTFFGIPGAEEFSHTVHTLQATLATRDAVVALEHAQKPTIMVIGAGLSGVEVAGELVDYFKARRLALDARICLVEMMPRMLPACPYDKVADCVEEFLCARGVEALTETAVQEVSAHKITFKSGQKLPYDLIIWTAGIKPNSLLERLNLPKVKGWLKLDQYLRVEGMEEVFAVGDTAYFERDGVCSGQNVEEAEYQGKTAAKNILRTLNNQELSAYKPKNTRANPRALISMGADKAVAFSGRRMFKPFAYHIKKFVEWRYMRRFR